MANLFRVKNIISKNQQRPQSAQHQFLLKIIGHIDYLFQGIINNQAKSSKVTKEIAQQKNEPILFYQKQGSVAKANDSLINSNIEKSNQSLSNQSQIPSIEEISNFQSENSEEKKSTKKIKKDKTDKEKKKLKLKLNKIQKKRLFQNTKKPISSFVFFYKDRLSQIKQSKELCQQPMTIGNLAKMLSKQWKSLGQTEKLPYLHKAEKSLQKYYQDKLIISQKMRKNSLKKMKKTTTEESNNDKNEQDPKHIGKDINSSNNGGFGDQCSNKNSLSSFFVYLNEHSDRLSKQFGYTKRGKIAKLAAEEWRKLSPAQRKCYEDGQKNKKNQLEPEQTIISSQKLRIRFKKDQEEYVPRIYRRNRSKERSEKDNKIQQEQNSNLSDINITESFKKTQHQSLFKDNTLKSINEQAQDCQQSSNMGLKFEEKQVEKKNRHTTNNSAVIELDSNEQERQMKEELKITSPISPFLIYYQKNLKELMLNNPTAMGSDLVKVASKMWLRMSQMQKKVYYEQTKQIRSNYQHEAIEQFKQVKMEAKRNRREISSEQ